MNDAYQQGRDARLAGDGKDACPYGRIGRTSSEDGEARRDRASAVLRAWWLAGFHDADIECGKRLA